MNLPIPSAVVIISLYRNAGQRGKNPGKLALAFFSFASVCSSLEMQFPAVKIIAVYCQLN